MYVVVFLNYKMVFLQMFYKQKQKSKRKIVITNVAKVSPVVVSYVSRKLKVYKNCSSKKKSMQFFSRANLWMQYMLRRNN